MRITIVKDNKFKTIGLHVETTNPGAFTPERVFSLGIHPSSYNFSKVVNGDYYEKEVFALIQADINLNHAKDTMSIVADAISRAGIKVEPCEDGGFSLGKDEYYTSIVERAEKTLWCKIEALEEAIIARQSPK